MGAECRSSRRRDAVKNSDLLDGFKLRAELVERGFALILDRGVMRRVWLRGRDNVQKRYLIHVTRYNLGLLMRLLTGGRDRTRFVETRDRVLLPGCQLSPIQTLLAAPAAPRRLIHPGCGDQRLQSSRRRPALAASSLVAESIDPSVAALTPTSRDTCSTDELSLGNSIASCLMETGLCAGSRRISEGGRVDGQSRASVLAAAVQFPVSRHWLRMERRQHRAGAGQ
jgi:hypothetical protein